ncbi:MAG TPA: HEAT repeat domain-containing protein, partial [Parachlamydiaceae bacterium]|nr:HEAT repeat domain-containing protein [Parachlamydiaceae bacterium]
FEHAVRPTIEMAKSLKIKIDDSFLEVKTLLDRSGGPGRLEFLIHVKTLETLLFQRPVSQGAISQNSLLTMQESFAAADAMMIYQSQLEHPAHFADILMDGTQRPIEDVYGEWRKFLLRLEPIAESVAKGQDAGITQSEISRFKTTLHTLRQGGVLPLYMTFFLSEMNLNKPVGAIRSFIFSLSGMNLNNPIDAVRAIIASLPLDEEPMIEQIFVQRKEIRQLRSDISQIANPKTYAEMLVKLQKAVDDFLPENQTWLQKAQWEKTSPITRSIALQTMNELVNLYDTAIKTMKASLEIGSDIEKTKKFKEMLGTYLKLLKVWSKDLVGANKYVTNYDWPLDSYITMLEKIFVGLAEANPENLRPSRDFSVSAAVLDAGTAFEHHFPVTLEDVFTLVHQNLIVSTALLTKELFSINQIKNSPLPQLLKSSLESVKKIGGTVGIWTVGVPQLTGIEVDQTGITFYYNVPLRSHSGKLSIHYDRLTETISLQGQFLGVGGARWAQGREKLEILNLFNIIPLQSEVKETLQELTFSWIINTQVHLEKALDEYRTQAVDSLNFPFRSNRVTDLVNELAKDRDISEIVLLMLNKNKSGLEEYERTIVEVFLNSPLNAHLLSAPSILKLLGSIQHPLINKLKNSLISQSKGIGIEEVKEESGVERNFLEHALKLFQNDPTLIYQLPINSMTEDIWRELISKPKGISEIFVKAKKGLINLNHLNQGQVFERLLIGTLDSGHGIAETLELGLQAMQDQDRDARNSAVNLLSEIAKHRQWFPKIISIGQEAMKDQDWIVRASAIKLLMEIAKQGQGIQEIISIALQAFQDQNSEVRNLSVWLLSEIAKQGEGTPEFIPIAQQAMHDQNWIVRTRAIELLMEIAKRGQGIPDILPIAQQAMLDQHWTVRTSAIKLLREITKQGQGVQDIITIAQQTIQNQNEDVRYSFVTLLSEIAKQGHGIPEIIPIAQQAMQDQAWIVRREAVNLLIGIAKQGQGISEIIPIAQQAMQDKFEDVRASAAELQKVLNNFGK